jgi:predicted DNA-binding protein
VKPDAVAHGDHSLGFVPSGGSSRSAGGEEDNKKKRGGLHPMYFTSLRGYPEEMEVRFTPEVQTKLEQMARETGRPSEELVEDALVGYFDELAHAREMLDRRFDDLVIRRPER